MKNRERNKEIQKDIDAHNALRYDEGRISSTFPVAPEGNFSIFIFSASVSQDSQIRRSKEKGKVLYWKKSSVFSMSRTHMQNG